MNLSKGENLIFLISQPRAGSTLTQRILGAHPDIHTQSETWILLHPLHALKPQGMQAAYDAGLYAAALRDFNESMPGGEAHYKSSVAETYNGFYNTILEKEGRKFFLDKTPRYYHIIPELADYFPEARFIFLWRNPAAVVSSILTSWVKKNWHTMAQYKSDLLLAPQAMIDGIGLASQRAISIKYEDLIMKPEQMVREICSFLGLKYSNSIMEYYSVKYPAWKFGDEKTLSNTALPDESRIDSWKLSLQHPQSWRVMHEYIQALGEETVTNMGYSWNEIIESIESGKPKGNIDSVSIPLNTLMDNSRELVLESRQLFYQLEASRKVTYQKEQELKLKLSDIRDKDEKIRNMDASLKRLSEQQLVDAEKISEMNIELTQLKKLLDSAKDEAELHEKLLADKDELIKKLETDSLEYIRKLQEKDAALHQIEDELIRSKKMQTESEDLIAKLSDESYLLENQVGSLEAKVRSLEETNIQQEKLLHQAQDISDQANALNSSLEKMLSQKIRLIEELKLSEEQRSAMLEEKDVILGNLNETVVQQANQLDETLTMLEMKHAEIVRLQGILSAKENDLNEKNDLIKKIEKSYTFRTGKVLLWPFKKILGR